MFIHSSNFTYELDFADPARKIDLEIDGEQHFTDSRIIKHDIKRNNLLNKLGWSIFRVKWSKFKSASLPEKIEVIQNIIANTNPNKDYVLVIKAQSVDN